MKSTPHASTRLARAFTLATLFGCLSAGSLFAGSETWTRTTTGGNWSDLANWASGTGYADGTDAVATLSASGTQTVNLDTNVTLGSIAFSNGTYTVSSSNGSVITLATSSGTPSFNSTGTIAATLAGTQGLTFNPGGNRTLTLSGNNTYSGVTTLTGANLVVQSSNALGATGVGNGTLISRSSAGSYPQLHFKSTVTTAEDFTISIGYNNATGGATVGDNPIFNVDAGSTTTLSGNFTLLRANANTNGTNNIDEFRMVNGASLTISGNISGAVSNATYQASGTYANPNRLTLQTSSAANFTSISGVISDGTIGTGGLSVYTTTNSNGSVRFSGANTYSGSTTHQKGILLINNTAGSGTGTGAVSVASAAVFGGTGIVAPTGANGIAFSSGAIVAPGDMTSTNVAIAAGENLAFDLSNTTGQVTFASGAIISIDLNGDSSTVAESFSFLGLNAGVADVLFNGNTVNFSVSGTALADGLYTLATFDANNAYSGNWVIGTGLEAYSAKTPQLIFNANSIQLQIGTVAIPEPSSFAALGGALALGFAATGRRRRK